MATGFLDRVDAQSMPSTRTAKAQPNIVDPSEEEVRQRAYEIYLARGGSHGDPDQDWWAAETQLSDGTRPGQGGRQKNAPKGKTPQRPTNPKDR